MFGESDRETRWDETNWWCFFHILLFYSASTYYIHKIPLPHPPPLLHGNSLFISTHNDLPCLTLPQSSSQWVERTINIITCPRLSSFISLPHSKEACSRILAAFLFPSSRSLIVMIFECSNKDPHPPMSRCQAVSPHTHNIQYPASSSIAVELMLDWDRDWAVSENDSFSLIRRLPSWFPVTCAWTETSRVVSWVRIGGCTRG